MISKFQNIFNIVLSFFSIISLYFNYILFEKVNKLEAVSLSLEQNLQKILENTTKNSFNAADAINSSVSTNSSTLEYVIPILMFIGCILIVSFFSLNRNKMSGSNSSPEPIISSVNKESSGTSIIDTKDLCIPEFSINPKFSDYIVSVDEKTINVIDSNTLECNVDVVVRTLVGPGLDSIDSINNIEVLHSNSNEPLGSYFRACTSLIENNQTSQPSTVNSSIQDLAPALLENADTVLESVDLLTRVT